jgi:hypothetical protein
MNQVPRGWKEETDIPQAYISGNAVIILKGPQEILQTIYVDEVDELEAVTIEEGSGRIAVCSQEQVYIYGPVGRDEGVLKVQPHEAVTAVTDTTTVVSHAWLGHKCCTARLDIVMGFS